MSDRRHIIVSVCQHPASPIHRKQPQVIMQAVVSDNMAAGRLAVCLSDRQVQRALAIKIKLWRLGHPWWLIRDSGRAGAKAREHRACAS